jgi:5-methylcytosine-specific restriction endonuclease McrA
MATSASEQAAPQGAKIRDRQRRIRELRDEEGMQIPSHVELHDLEPGTKWAKLRAEVLDRNGFTCQMCGLAPGDIDSSTGRKVRLHIGHIKDKSLGGKDELSNLRALCSTCNQGAKNITGEKPTGIWLLSQIRRAGQDEQRAVFDWLRKKFGE